MIELENSINHERHTPHHSAGFSTRLGIVFNQAGIRHREYVALISKSTGLSKVGARKMLQADRPPKKMETFRKLVQYLTELLQNKDMTVDSLSEYLLTGNKNPFEHNFSLSEFLEKDPVLTSQIILKIEDLAKTNNIDTSKDIDQEGIKRIYYRIADYIFKNDISLDSDNLETNILSILQVTKDNVI